ncbi:MAG: hypothetical protein WBZ45_06615 [Acidimicrobiia bacterium]
MPHPTVTRLCARAVIEPGTVPGYGPIFNAGLLYENDRFHLFARGVREGYLRNPGAGPRFLDYRSDVLMFSSSDGVDYEFEYVLAAGSEVGVWSYEDPRVQRVLDADGVTQLFMTYTDLPAPEEDLTWRIGIHRIVFDGSRIQLNRDSGRVIGPPGTPDKDAVVFNLSDGRVALIHRAHHDIQLAIFDSVDDLLSPDPGYWDRHMSTISEHTIIRPSPRGAGVGAGAPPIATESGLLFFYHERSSESVYDARVCLLDPATARVVATVPEPVLVPELSWECHGEVDNVVFVQGAHSLGDGRIYVTYGAGDQAVGVGVIEEQAILDALIEV